MTRPAILAAFVFLLNLVAGCRFDPSGVGFSDGPLFAGCFQGNETTLQLENPMDDLLRGSLVIGQGAGQQVFVLEGKAENSTLAILQGTRPGSGGDTEEISVFRSSGDTMIVQIEDGPPSAALPRCP